MLPQEQPGTSPYSLADVFRDGPRYRDFRDSVIRHWSLEPGQFTRRRAIQAKFYTWLFLRPPYMLRTINPYPRLLRRLKFERVEFQATDGLRLRGLYRPGADPSRVLVILHGRIVNKEFMLPYAAVVPKDWTLFLFDFRGHGASASSDCSLGYYEQRDLAGAVRWLADRGGRRFGLWGLSMGAAVSLLYASKDPRVAAVVSEAGYASMRELLEFHREERGLPGWPFVPMIKHYMDHRLGFDVDKVNPAESIRSFRRPLLHVHGLADGVVPAHHARRIVAEAGPTARLMLMNGGHGTLMWRHREVYYEPVLEFFRRHLP